MFEIFIGLIFLGVFAGLLSGFFGIGSGVILVPAYVFLFDYLNFRAEVIPLLATGTSMTTMAFTLPVASYTHYRNGKVNFNFAKKMILIAFLATLLGRYLALFMESETLQQIIAISLILAAVQIAFDFKPNRKNSSTSIFELIVVSGSIGIITSFVGIGGGILLVPYFTYKGLNMHEAIGTSSIMGFSIAVAGATGAFLFNPSEAQELRFVIGSAYIPAVLVAGLTSMYFARLGANISANTESKMLKQAFAILVIIAALRVFYITYV